MKYAINQHANGLARLKQDMAGKLMVVLLFALLIGQATCQSTCPCERSSVPRYHVIFFQSTSLQQSLALAVDAVDTQHLGLMLHFCIRCMTRCSRAGLSGSSALTCRHARHASLHLLLLL